MQVQRISGDSRSRWLTFLVAILADRDADSDGPWIRAEAINGHDVFEYAPDRAREVGNHFDWRSPDMWHFMEVPERQWVIDGWLPKGQVALLTGEGGAGKSLLAQQLCTAIAFEQPFMGLTAPAGMNAVYLTCEDDFDELHRRQVAICAALGVGMSDFDGRLFLVSLRGAQRTELMGPDLEPTEVFNKLRETADLLCRQGLLVLDNVAHLFGGNENDRHHVATFFHAIDQLALEFNCTIILLGHPPKSGAQFSGSTAWENQVRTRLYLTRSDSSEGFEDPDTRILTRSKSNYARGGERLSIRWKEWAFVLDAEDPSSWSQGLAGSAAAASENHRFLQCLEKATAQRRALSHSPHAGNYAPKVMAGMPAGRGLTRDAFKQAMERLLELGTIRADQALWAGADRKPVRGLAAVSDAGRLRDGSTDGAVGDTQAIENVCGMVVRDGLRDGPTALRDGSPASPDFPCGMVAGWSQDGLPGSVRGENPPKGGSSPHLDTDPFAIDDSDLEPM
jgi:RecA-family ATPase